MLEVSSDIYFVVYNLYYVDQNDDLKIRTRPINRDRGSKLFIRLWANVFWIGVMQTVR
jgi:hypothetical protein